LAAIERLNHVFQLRDCSRDVPVHFADQRTLFDQDWQAGCLRGSLASCSAPCAAGCSRPAYCRQIERAIAFLDGEDRRVLEQMESAMREASERHEFERAIGHRDALQELTYLAEELQLLRDVARDFWFVYPIHSVGSSNLWNVVAGGDVVAVAAEPGTEARARATSELLEKVFRQQDRQAHVPFEQFDRVRLVASWFRHHPEELENVMSPEDAIARCRTRASS
jgi:excinuclease ABC subunit C